MSEDEAREILYNFLDLLNAGKAGYSPSLSSQELRALLCLVLYPLRQDVL